MAQACPETTEFYKTQHLRSRSPAQGGRPVWGQHLCAPRNLCAGSATSVPWGLCFHRTGGWAEGGSGPLVSSAAPGQPPGHLGCLASTELSSWPVGCHLSMPPTTLTGCLAPALGAVLPWAFQLGFQDTWWGVSESQTPEALGGLGVVARHPSAQLASCRALCPREDPGFCASLPEHCSLLRCGRALTHSLLPLL